MKTTTKKLFSLLLLIVTLSSCNVNMFNQINGNRNVITEDRSSKEIFSRIKVSSGLDLYLNQGSRNRITVEADENLHDIIVTEIDNGVLKIYTEKGIWNAKSKKIHVTVKNIESLTATSGANVFTNDEIKADNIKVSANSGARIDLYLEANTVETNATSGSDIDIFGSTVNHISSASSGASIDAYELESRNVNVTVSSGANINIYASESLNASASSGGDIDFKGDPKEISKKSSSGGSVSAK